MTSKEQKHPESSRLPSKQREPKPAIENLEVIARQQIPPAPILQSARFDPSSLTVSSVLQLQRAIGNQAVHPLLAQKVQPKPAPQSEYFGNTGTRRSLTANSQTGLLQRVLNVDSEIKEKDILNVKQVPNKLVFILTGNGSLVVKFEQGTGNYNEDNKQWRGRAKATNWFAKQVLSNVPGQASLTKKELKELGALSANGDVSALRDVIADYDQGRYFAKKMTYADVGKSLQDMTKVEHDSWKNKPDIWKMLGETAAYDLLVGNKDRFWPDGSVNLENIDIIIKNGGTSMVQLDNLTREASVAGLQAEGQFGWEHHQVLRKAAQRGKFAEKAVAYLNKKLPLGGNDKMTTLWSTHFKTGFNRGTAAMKAARKKIQEMVNSRSNSKAGRAHLQWILNGIDTIAD